MKNYLKTIEEKITNQLSVEKIIIIDNSHKHKKHKFFDSEKYHLCLEINSKYLSSLKTLDAQRLIMKILDDELKSKVHALEIKIK
jgi:BolA protein